jgi:hypothetical protein
MYVCVPVLQMFRISLLLSLVHKLPCIDRKKTKSTPSLLPPVRIMLIRRSAKNSIWFYGLFIIPMIAQTLPRDLFIEHPLTLSNKKLSWTKVFAVPSVEPPVKGVEINKKHRRPGAFGSVKYLLLYLEEAAVRTVCTELRTYVRMYVCMYVMLYVCMLYVSPPLSSFKWAPGVFCTYFYNHARRLRLEKLLCLELSRSSNGFLKPLLDPGGGFTSETAARRFSEVKRPLRNRFGSETATNL